MALILPSRFYRQPTSNLIDTGNPISRGLNAGYLASTRSFFGSASSAQAVPNATYKYNPRFGVALRNNVNSSSMAVVRTPIGASADATVLSVFLPSTTVTETYSGHLGHIGSGFSLGITIGNGSASVIRGRAYLSGTRYFGGGTTITDFDKPIVGVVRQKVGVEQALFLDGIKDATTSAFTGGTLGYGFIGNAGVGAGYGQFLTVAWGRALSDAEIWELAQDPYQIFHRPNCRIWVDVISSGVSGTLATTNAADTVSASGTTTIVGTVAYTNAADTSAASGSVGAGGFFSGHYYYMNGAGNV